MEQSYRAMSASSTEPVWADCYTMFPDGPASAPLQSPQWIRADSSSRSHSAFTSEASSFSSRNQLSPISTSADIPQTSADSDYCPAASASVPVREYRISSTPPFLASHSVPPPHIIDSVSAYGNNHTEPGQAAIECAPTGPSIIRWHMGTNERPTAFKLESLDEGTLWPDDLQEAPFNVDASDVQALALPKEKRPRGRPRKHNLAATTPMAGKTGKGRSRTGCITCKKRKKKCDELRPRSADELGPGYTGMNCEKNGIVCEGYAEMQIWKSSKEKAEEELLKNQSVPGITMQPIFIGLETTGDRVLWKYHNEHLSSLFTVEGAQTNAFKDILVPLATRQQGMMHSLLSLADTHLDCKTPYGQQILRRTAKVTADSLKQRGSFHRNMAAKNLFESMEHHTQDNDPASQGELDACYGQILYCILESLAKGNSSESQFSQYEDFLSMIHNRPPVDPAFLDFLVEIFYYHIFADDIVCYPTEKTRRLVTEFTMGWIPMALHQPRLLGVADGLFYCLSQITTIRNHIRTRINSKTDPQVDYESLYRASDIESDIIQWSPTWPAGDSRVRATLLYKQMTWLYLKTTICPPPPSHSLARATWLLDNPSVSLMASLQPRPSTATSCASALSPKLEVMAARNKLTSSSRRHSIANPYVAGGPSPFPLQAEAYPKKRETPRSMVRSRASPPPSRLPASHDSRVSVAVEESLLLLESFGTNDPVQTLLLVPCVVIGALCYSPAERVRIRNAIRVVHDYTGFRNTDNALCILDEVWRLMDLGDYLDAWDWQAVAARLGISHLF